jgi:hypothetical protein
MESLEGWESEETKMRRWQGLTFNSATGPIARYLG